tara:strand:- start:9590 stop:10462 length:873 start_codon:yes stop_codon:yes gene_type:complete
MNYDLFGNPVIEKTNLKQDFIIPPFSVFNTADVDWQERKLKWKSLGIKSEIGRSENLLGYSSTILKNAENAGTSIFDPVLAEIIYTWFCKKRGKILDPFAGGSVRGIVSSYLNYCYTGIELRNEQVIENYRQAKDIVPDNTPHWISGDSDRKLDSLYDKYDLIFSCPPYYDLEKYSDDENDISNMSYDDFNKKYRSIIKKSCFLLKENSFAAFVIGNVRDKRGNIKSLYSETIKAFEDSGLKFYNDIVLRNPTGTAAPRARRIFTYRKVTTVHQYVLVFVKGDAKKHELE